MNWFVFNVFIICYIISLTNGTSDRDDEVSIHESSLDFKNEMNRVIVDHFVALPAELKKIILGYLSPNELFEFTQIDDLKVYYDLAAEAYRGTYGDVAVFVKGFVHDVKIDTKPNVITIQGIEKLSKYLRTFNKSVKNIKIDFGTFKRHELSELLEEITKNCGESLTRLEMRNSYQGELERIHEISFPNVEEVVFFNCYSSMDAVNFTRVFPKVRRLSALLTYFSDRTWIQDNFVNLTHLNLHTGSTYIREEDVMEILRHNPHVHTLGLNQYTPELLEMINSMFPNVVNLGLMSLPFAFTRNIEPIHMRHVERLFYKGNVRHLNAAFMKFEGLRELHWNIGLISQHFLIKLIDENRNTIEKLDIVDTIISDAHLMEMFNMPELKMASFTFHPESDVSFSADKLLNFIKSNDKLEKVRLINAYQRLRQDLMKKFKSSQVSGWLTVFDPSSDQNGDIHFVIHNNFMKQFGSGGQVDTQRFFNDNLY